MTEPPEPPDSAPQAGPVRLQLLRNPQWLQGTQVQPLNANDAALLALLAVDGPTQRDRAITLLWPDAPDPGRARNALRQRLFRLRRLAGAGLVGPGEPLHLAPGLLHDLQDPLPALTADPAQALAGDLLGDTTYDSWPAFADWLSTARATWRSRRAEALAALAARLEAGNEVAQALLCAQRLAHDAPLHEHAQRQLMRLHYRRGDRSAALAVHARLTAALAAELGAAPSAETQALASLITSSSSALPQAAAPQGLTLLRPPQLVGRQADWALARAALQHGRTVVLLGEPGIGKSRLLADLAGAGGQVLVSARPGDARLPYAVLVRLLRQLDLNTDSLPHSSLHLLAGLLPELAPVQAGEANPSGQHTHAARPGRLASHRLLPVLHQVLAQAAPAGVALDDLHYADEASLDLLPALVAARPWLLAMRPQDPPDAQAAARAAAVQASSFVVPLATCLAALQATGPAGPGCTTIRLAVLDVPAVQALLVSLALPGIDAGWATRVHRHSGGNPLFILETLRALLAGSAAQGVLAATVPPPALPVPDSLRRLIGERLARLSPAALKLAQVAAIAGLDFEVDLAATVLGVHALDLQPPWAELEAAQVMQGTGFAHDLIVEATQDALPAALRRWLHAQVAAWLHSHQGVPARLALHWGAAGEPARAAAAFEQAAAAALAAGRLAEQARWLAAAVDAHAQAGQPRERFRVLALAAVAVREASPPAAALQAAQALLAAAGDKREQGIAQQEIAVCHMYAMRFAAAVQALELATSAGDSHAANHARYLQAVASTQLSGPLLALQRLEALRAWADSQPDVSLRHCYYTDLAIVCDQADQRQRACTYFERTLAFFAQQNETANAASARTLYARTLLMLGQPVRARALLEAAVHQRAEASEGAGGNGTDGLHLARVCTELGAYGDAIALLTPALAQAAQPGDQPLRAAMTLALARVYVHLGQTTRAQLLCNSLPDAAAASLPFHLQALRLWTSALLQPERPVERARLLDAALALFTQHVDLPFVRLPIQLDRLLLLPPDDALPRLRAAVAECGTRELWAPQMLGRMRLLQVLVRQADWASALPVAHRLVADQAGPAGMADTADPPDMADTPDTAAPTACQPVGGYLPELWWACRAAALGAGDQTLADACLDRAAQWIARVAQQQVPESFRRSFADRNPVNRALLAATLGGANTRLR